MSLPFFGLFLTVAILIGAILSTGSVVLEELSLRRYPKITDLLKLIGAGFLENFGYRQLTLWWRVKGSWDYLRGETAWGSMQRRGFAELPTATPRPRTAAAARPEAEPNSALPAPEAGDQAISERYP